MQRKEMLVEEVMNLIQANHVVETSNLECQMYRIGENTAKIIVACDACGEALYAICKSGSKMKTFADDNAIKISTACKTKLKEQKHKASTAKAFGGRIK